MAYRKKSSRKARTKRASPARRRAPVRSRRAATTRSANRTQVVRIVVEQPGVFGAGGIPAALPNVAAGRVALTGAAPGSKSRF